MSSEVTVRSGLTVRNGNLQYDAKPNQFTGDQSVANGPSPGSVTVPTTGVNVVLTALATPAYCRLMNIDATNYVRVGVWDNASALFLPLLELLPGETYVVRLSRDLLTRYDNAGNPVASPLNALRLMAHSAPCVVLVEAFDA